MFYFIKKNLNVFDKFNFKSKLGWILGFRKQSYLITTALTKSECFLDLHGPKYLYLVVDEFTQNNMNSFMSPQSGYLMNKNILARITIDSTSFQFGSIIPATNLGYLLTDRRNYNGIIDIKKMNIQMKLKERIVNITLKSLAFHEDCLRRLYLNSKLFLNYFAFNLLGILFVVWEVSIILNTRK